MRKDSTTQNRTPRTVSRGRIAVVGGGVVAALALGSTAAFAATSHSSEHAADFMAAGTATGISSTVHKQADSQKKAAADAAVKAKAAAARAKAEAAAKKRAKAKAAAAHKITASSWVTPTTGYKLGAGYAQAGPHWIHTHSGQDFVVNSGTTVRAAHGGTVVTAGWGGAYGNNIVIKHGSHLYTQYGHLSKIGVHVGEHVNTAEKIGLSGSTGNSTGPHLHFEVRTTPYYGSSVEPLHFLRAHHVNP
jgi:murein DD-endopeptidase MepM/ murein hydrolase activator NlpD